MFEFLLDKRLFETPGGSGSGAGAGGAAGAAAGGAAAGGAAAGGADAGGAGAGGADAGGAGADAGDTGKKTPDVKWWQSDALTEDQKTTITAAGLTLDDPVEAVAKLADMERAAKKRLGANPDDLLTKPKDGQDVAEWLRQHGDIVGIPKDADGYEIKPPESWPEDAKWDADFEKKVREAAHESGIPQPALQKIVDIYAEKVAALEADAVQEQTAAQQEMMSALKNEWGDQTDAKLARARQALSVISEQAGLDADAQRNLLDVMADKAGDANVWKMMDVIAQSMGEDAAAGLGAGGKTIGTTPAEARAQIEKMTAPDGDYTKAFNNRGQDPDELKRQQQILDRLSRLATT